MDVILFNTSKYDFNSIFGLIFSTGNFVTDKCKKRTCLKLIVRTMR